METTTPATSTADSHRVEQFKSDVGEMKLKAGNAGRERLAGIVGLILMLVGPIGSFLLWQSSMNLSDPRDLQSSLIGAVMCLAVSVLGAGLFVRYAFANFLRMWLLRRLYEGQANADRIVEAIAEGRS